MLVFLLVSVFFFFWSGVFGTGSGFWFPIWAHVFGFGARSFGIGVDLFGYGSKRWDWGSRGSGIRADLFGLGSFVGICIEQAI